VILKRLASGFVPVACPIAWWWTRRLALAAPFQLLGGQLAGGVRDLVLAFLAAVQVDQCGPLVVVPIRSISSQTLAPTLAARVFPYV